MIIYANFHSLHIKFGFDWPSSFREEDKIGQGHPRVMIYTNFVELHSQMLHTKFQNHRPSGSKEEDFKGFCYL